jgi:hypothetical protein
MKCEIAPVERWHLVRVAAHARTADVEEVWASSHQTVAESLRDAQRTCLQMWSGLVDGDPACIFGVSPASLMGGIGVPWMLGTDVLHTAERPLARLSRPVVEVMQGWFPLLVNVVDNRNERAHRWLSWLGFTLSKPHPFGPDGELFRTFTRTR